LKYKPIGKLELGVEELEFIPSKREVDVKFFSTMEWKPLKAKFTLGGATHEGTVTKLNTSSELSYKGLGSAANVELSFKTFVDYSDPALSVGASAKAKYKIKIDDIPVGLLAEGMFKHNLISPDAPKNEGKLMFSLSVDI
jgi:hypothetical protein